MIYINPEDEQRLINLNETLIKLLRERDKLIEHKHLDANIRGYDHGTILDNMLNWVEDQCHYTSIQIAHLEQKVYENNKG